MSVDRSFSLTQFSHDSRADRPAAPVYTIAGRYDRRAIMRQAVAKARQLGWGMPWSRRMAVALKTVWAWAKKEMAAPVAPVLRPVVIPVQAPRRGASQVRTFDRGSRIFSHGW